MTLGGRVCRLAFVVLGLLPASHAWAQRRPIDVAQSRITVRVFKAGLFGGFGHNHEITAPVERGWVETGAKPGVSLEVDARKLKVADPDLETEKRAEVQKTMEGPEVLDAGRSPEIRFESTAVEPAGQNQWTVRGNLRLHGQTQPVSVDVTFGGNRYRGSATILQTSFGIKPVSAAGGTIKTKNEVRIEFEIVLQP